jgi:hypothetical protein
MAEFNMRRALLDEEENPAQQGPSVRTLIPPNEPPIVQPPRTSMGRGAQTILNGGGGTASPQMGPVQAQPAASNGPSVTDAFFENSRRTMRQVGQDMSAAASRGNYGQAAGEAIIGGAAMLPAAIEDIFGGPGRVLKAALPDATDANVLTHLRDAGSAIASPYTNGNGPAPVQAKPLGPSTMNPAERGGGGTITDPGHNGVNRIADPVSLRAAVQPTAPVPDTDPYTGGSISKQITQAGNGYFTGNKDGTFTWVDAPAMAQKGTMRSYGDPSIKGTKAMSELGGGGQQIQLPDGTNTTAERYAAAQAQALKNEDPVARGMRQQLEQNEAIMAQAERMAGSNPAGREARVIAAMAQLKTGDPLNAGTQMRGQDVLAEGHRATTKAAAAKAQYEAAKDQRQYEFDLAKHGTETANKNREARAAEQKAVRETLEARYVDKDGKPDGKKIAEFTAAVETTLPDDIKRLRAVGTPAALAKAEQLATRGLGAFEPGDYDRMHQRLAQRERFRQASGGLYGQGTFVQSNNLNDYEQAPGASGIRKTLIGGDKVVTRGGSNASIRDMQYEDGPANMVLPDIFKTDTRDLLRGYRTK